MTRLLQNLVKLPSRTLASMKRRGIPAYAIQREADHYVKQHMPAAMQQQLAAVPGYTSDRKCRLLYYLALNAPETGGIVEIGSYKGKSTAWLAQAARESGKAMLSIDPHLEDSLETFGQIVKQFKIDEVATIHRALSSDIGKDFQSPTGFLWIDGGHTYECVMQDIKDFTPHVVPGGTIVFDDYDPQRYPGIIKAISETLMADAQFEHLGVIKSFALFRRQT